MRRGFSLLELLVSIAVIGVIVSIVTPALMSARTAARSAVCLSNLRQSFLACAAYAQEHSGEGPAIGVPWGSLPNWGLVVQTYAGARGEGPSELYDQRSVLVCPVVDDHYDQNMTRTYAMNATGHAGAPGDPDDYDEGPAHIRFDLVERPSDVPLLVDSQVAWFPSDAPPPTRSSSVIDFRDEEHIRDRLAPFHDGEQFNAVFFDGSVQPRTQPDSYWSAPLP